MAAGTNTSSCSCQGVGGRAKARTANEAPSRHRAPPCPLRQVRAPGACAPCKLLLSATLGAANRLRSCWEVTRWRALGSQLREALTTTSAVSACATSVSCLTLLPSYDGSHTSRMNRRTYAAEAQRLKWFGNDALQNNQLSLALRCYSKALSELPDDRADRQTCELRTVYLLNRAQAYVCRANGADGACAPLAAAAGHAPPATEALVRSQFMRSHPVSLSRCARAM